MTTTLTEFPPSRRVPNYSSRPTKDVEILPAGHHCQDCQQPVAYEADHKPWGKWVHTDGSAGHFVSPRPSCRYCGTDDPELVTFKQHAWYDAVECSRCGGVNGFALGD